MNWTTTFNGYEKRASPVKPPLQFEMDVSTPAEAANNGVSAGRTAERWEQPDAFGMPVERRRPIRQYSDSSKVIAQNQDPYSRSKCQFCPKQFSGVSHLRVHERVHTGDGPFKCDVCGKSFTQSGYLCVRKRTHTGHRPFKCDVCGVSFSQPCHLSVHKRNHTRDMPHK